jgi:hypothetical protein
MRRTGVCRNVIHELCRRVVVSPDAGDSAGACEYGAHDGYQELSMTRVGVSLVQRSGAQHTIVISSALRNRVSARADPGTDYGLTSSTL